MQYTGDPLADFMAYDAEQEKALSRLPVCADCGHPIQDEHFYLINGEYICPVCIENNYRRNTDDYIE